MIISQVTRTKQIVSHNTALHSVKIFRNAVGGATLALACSAVSGQWGNESGATQFLIIPPMRLDRGFSQASNVFQMDFDNLRCPEGLWCYVAPSQTGVTVSVFFG